MGLGKVNSVTRKADFLSSPLKRGVPEQAQQKITKAVVSAMRKAALPASAASETLSASTTKPARPSSDVEAPQRNFTPSSGSSSSTAVFQEVLVPSQQETPEANEITETTEATGSKESATALANRSDQFTEDMVTTAIDQIGDYGEASNEGEGLKGLKEESKEILHKGCPTSPCETTRNRFLERLQKRFVALASEVDENPATQGKSITMKELLGPELLKEYKEAIKEEANDARFRDAVFNESSETMKGSPCPGNKLVMYIGGPSASGKSFARGKFIKRLQKMLTPKGPGAEVSKDSNFVVSVDGGIERELSQVRKMVLQVSNNLGHTDIKDLHKHTKLDAKAKIHKVAENEGNNYHLVIPATFIAEMKQLLPMMRRLGKDKTVHQAFAMVESDQDTTFHNGNSRACLDSEKAEAYREPCEMNKTGLKESKVYEGKFYGLGVKASGVALQVFKTVAGSRSTTMTSKADNRHVSAARDPGGKVLGYNKVRKDPEISHVSQLEVDLWEGLNASGGDKAMERASIEKYVKATHPKLTGTKKKPQTKGQKEKLADMVSDMEVRLTAFKEGENIPDLKELLGILKETPNLRAPDGNPDRQKREFALWSSLNTTVGDNLKYRAALQEYVTSVHPNLKGEELQAAVEELERRMDPLRSSDSPCDVADIQATLKGRANLRAQMRITAKTNFKSPS